MNCVTSCRCRRVGRSGYWAARVWRRCHVARPTSARAASSVLREADVDVDESDEDVESEADSEEEDRRRRRRHQDSDESDDFGVSDPEKLFPTA